MDGVARLGAAMGASGAWPGALSLVRCRGSTCWITLAGTGAGTHVLGTALSLASVDGNRADLRVGDRVLTCTAGEEVQAGSLRLTCTAVVNGCVTLTASRAR